MDYAQNQQLDKDESIFQETMYQLSKIYAYQLMSNSAVNKNLSVLRVLLVEFEVAHFHP